MGKKAFVIIATIIIASTVISYLFLDKITLFALSKFYRLDISYRSLNKDSNGTYVFEEIRLLNKKMGAGFFSQRAVIKPLWTKHSLKSIDFEFKFKDLHFIKFKKEVPDTKYDSLDQLVSIPFEGRWNYKEISGTVELFSNGLTLKNFSAEGREIRLMMSGDVFYNNVVDTDITIFFAKDVLKDIPPELTSVIMKDEPADWKSFSVKAKGNMSSPSLQVSGNLFRLNIGTLTVK